MEFLRSCESSHESNMVFLSPRRPSVMLDESHRSVSEYHERKNDVGDVFASLNNDLYVSRLNNLSKTQRSHKTTKAKRHVLELGAGLLRKDDRSIPLRFNRMRRNRSSELNIDFF